MRKVIVFLTAGLCCVSCGIARFQTVSDAYSAKVRVDTTFVLDSVYIDRIRTIREKADTVYIAEVVTEYKYRYRDRVKTDTLIVEKLVTQIEEVEKELTKCQKAQIKAFWWFAASFLVWIVLKVRRWWRR